MVSGTDTVAGRAALLGDALVGSGNVLGDTATCWLLATAFDSEGASSLPDGFSGESAATRSLSDITLRVSSGRAAARWGVQRRLFVAGDSFCPHTTLVNRPFRHTTSATS